MASTALMNNYGERALTLVKGEGMTVWDDQGRRFLDAVAGIAVCSLGHCHPAVTKAICEQAQRLVHCSNLYLTQEQPALAETLCDLAGMEKAFFSNSGAEANEAALKIARKLGNQRGIETPTVVTMNGSFHGRTMATLSATGNAKVKDGFSPLLSGFHHVPYGQLEAVEALSGDASVVAVMVEPIQGEGGVNIPPAGYLAGLRELCDRNQWLLILDEIQTGNGRTGAMFACQHEQVLPDILTTAKALGNGLPIGACLARGQAAEMLQPGSHGSTYGGNPLVCRAALAVLQTLKAENLDQHAASIGGYMVERFRQALSPLPQVAEIRGKGLMIGIELTRPCGELVAQAVERGVLINVTAGNTIRLLPPLVITKDQADQVIDSVCELVSSFAAD